MWKDILKDEESYSHQLGLIERLEKLLENLYDDIEEQAIKMNKETGYPVEEARKLIKNLQKDIINETEKTINRMRKELPRHINQGVVVMWFEELKKEKDACYRKVRSRYKKWPSAYASGALVQCRKVGAKNWGNSVKKGGDNFAREKKEGLHGWFSRRGGGGQKGWVSCQSCEDDKKGTKPCGRKDASKGTKQRCRPTCSACKTYKRRKGNKRSRGRGFTR